MDVLAFLFETQPFVMGFATTALVCVVVMMACLLVEGAMGKKRRFGDRSRKGSMFLFAMMIVSVLCLFGTVTSAIVTGAMQKRLR